MNDTHEAIRDKHATEAHDSRTGDAVDPALTMTNPTRGTDILDRPSGAVKGVIPPS